MHFLIGGTTTLAVLLAASSAAAQGSLYTKKSPVLQVDAKSYDKLITQGSKPSIVEFYAPWCGHCQNLKPAFEKAAGALDGMVQVAAVNCDDDANKPLCGRLGIKGFPTLKTVRVTGTPGKPIVMDYRGERSAKGIADAGKALLVNHVKRLEDAGLSEWLAEANGTAKAILFSDKGKTPALLKSLAIDFLGNLNVAQVRDTQEEAVGMFDVSDFPKLVVLPGGDKSPVVYEGKMEVKPMKAFLEKYAQLALTGTAPPKASKKHKDSKAKESKASKSYDEAASSHASAEASEAARSAASETVEEENTATESPKPWFEDAQKPVKMPDMPPPLPTLATQAELRSKCLGPKTGTCVIVVLPETAGGADMSEAATTAAANLAELSQKFHTSNAHVFPFYVVPAINDGAIALKSALALRSDEPELVAVNGKRGWWRHYNSKQGFDVQSLEAWIDGIKLGDVKKQELPIGFIEGEAAEEPEKHDEL